MWCDSFNVVFFCRGFIRHAVGSFVTAYPREQSVRFHTMGPRHSNVSVKLGDDFFASLSQRQREARQYYISRVCQGHRRNAVCVSLRHDVTQIHSHAHCMRNRPANLLERLPFTKITGILGYSSRVLPSSWFSGALWVQQVATRGDASDLYVWGTWFESWTERKLSLFRLLLVFFSPYRQMSGYCLKFGQGRFLPHPSLFIIQGSKYNSTLYILIYLQPSYTNRK